MPRNLAKPLKDFKTWPRLASENVCNSEKSYSNKQCPYFLAYRTLPWTVLGLQVLERNFLKDSQSTSPTLKALKWCGSLLGGQLLCCFWTSAFESTSRFAVEKFPSRFLFQKFLLSESAWFSFGQFLAAFSERLSNIVPTRSSKGKWWGAEEQLSLLDATHVHYHSNRSCNLTIDW